LQPIQSEADYQTSMKLLERIGFREKGENEGREAYAHALGVLIKDYAKEHYPMPLSDPIDTIKARLLQMGWTDNDLVGAIGLNKSKISEILNRKRRMSLDTIRKFSKTLGLSLELLAQEYPTEQSDVEETVENLGPAPEAALKLDLGTIAFNPETGTLWPMEELPEMPLEPPEDSNTSSLSTRRSRLIERTFSGRFRGALGLKKTIDDVGPVRMVAPRRQVYAAHKGSEPLTGTWISTNQLKTLARATENGPDGFFIVDIAAVPSGPSARRAAKARQIASNWKLGAGLDLAVAHRKLLALGCVYAGVLEDNSIKVAKGSDTARRAMVAKSDRDATPATSAKGYGSTTSDDN